LIISFFDGTVGIIKEKLYIKKTEEEKMGDVITNQIVIRIGIVAIGALACGWRFFTWSAHRDDACPIISGAIGTCVGSIILTVLTSFFVR
jgi:hypothetical protein